MTIMDAKSWIDQELKIPCPECGYTSPNHYRWCPLEPDGPMARLAAEVAALRSEIVALKGQADSPVSDATLKEAMVVLTGLRNGRELHSWSGHAYMDGEIWWATFQYLLSPGYVEQLPEVLTSNPPRYSYAITDEGRAALAEYEAAHGSR